MKFERTNDGGKLSGPTSGAAGSVEVNVGKVILNAFNDVHVNLYFR